MKKTKEEAEITKKKLLKAALKVFGEKGYAATTLTNIADEAGVTRGAIYWNFKDKEELFEAMLNEYSTVYFNFEGILSLNVPFEIKIKKIIKEFFARIEDDEEFRKILEIQNFKVEVSKEFERTYTKLIEESKKKSEMLLILVEEAIKNGELREVEPVCVVAVIMGFISGIQNLWLAEKKNVFSLKEKSDELIDILLNGFLKK